MSSGIIFHKATAKSCCLGERNRFEEPWLLQHLQRAVAQCRKKAQCWAPFLLHLLSAPSLSRSPSIICSSASAVFSPQMKTCAEGSDRGKMEWVGRKPKGRENEKEAITDREGECESTGRWGGRGIYEWTHRQNEDKCRIWEGRNESGWDCIHQVLILADNHSFPA